MAKVRTLDFTVRLNTRTHGILPGDIPALLDMLRYEAGQVVSWSDTDTGVLVTIRVDEHRFVPDRWRSFGITPFDLSDPDMAYMHGLLPVGAR